MLGNWIKCTTTTTGTGTLTLSAVTGYPTVGNWFSNGAVVAYALLDSSGLPIESGVGTYTASGTTLARSLVQATMVSGTLTKVGATAVSLTGTTTVIISQIAGVSAPGTRSPVNRSGVGQVRAGYTVGMSYGGSAVVANRVYISPYIHDSPRQIHGFTCYSAASTGNVRFGLYRLSSAGDIDALVADTGDKEVSSGASVYTLATDIWLPPDVYVCASVWSGTPSVRTTTISGYGPSVFGGDSSGYQNNTGYYDAGSFTLPASLSSPTFSNTAVPATSIVLG